MKIRDILLIVYGTAWAAAVGVALVKTGEVSPILWGALGGGVGTIIGAFRVEKPEQTAGGLPAGGGSPSAESAPATEEAQP